MAEEKAKTKAELRAPEAGRAQLQQQRKPEAARAHEETRKRDTEVAIAVMEEAERMIRRETPPGGTRVDTLPRFFDGDPASRMKIGLDAEDCRSSEGSVPATRPRRKCKGKTLEKPGRTAERHPHESDPFVTCSNGDGQNRQHCHEPTGCKVGAFRAGGGGCKDTPQSSGGEGLPPPYGSRESTPGRHR